MLNPNIWRSQQQTFDWHGHRISYQDQGDGPVLLLLHGLPGSNWVWHLLWPMLCGQFRLIAPDFLGCGDSDKPVPYDYRLADQAAMLDALLRHLGVETYQIIGHDYGAADPATDPVIGNTLPEQPGDAQQPTVSTPENIPADGPQALSMSWLSPRISGDHSGFIWRERWLSGPSGQVIFRRLISEGLYGRYLERLTGPFSPLTRQRLRDSWELLCAHQGLNALPLLLNYRYEMPQRREWPRMTIPLPLQIVYGQYDPVCRRLPVIPQVNYQSLPCGHYPQEEAPEALVAALLAFHSGEQKYRNGVFSNLKAADQPG